MKVLKNIGLFVLVLLLLALVGVGVYFGWLYLMHLGYIDYPEVPRPRSEELTNFDHDIVKQFDDWERSEQGEPDMYLPLRDGSYPLLYGIERDFLELLAAGGPIEFGKDYNYVDMDVEDGRVSAIFDDSVGEYVDDFDVSDRLRDGRPCEEMYGVDPAVDLIADGLSTLSFKLASYGWGGDLGTHAFFYFRGIDTGEYDYHISAQELNDGFVGNYEQRMIWIYSCPERSDEIAAYQCNSPYGYLASFDYSLIDNVRHWDGKSVIVAYCPFTYSKSFIYDIELNPELDDYLFTSDSLLRYHGLEFYKDLP